jgi:hypothetical protein
MAGKGIDWVRMAGGSLRVSKSSDGIIIHGTIFI